MNFDTVLLAAVAHELSEFAPGARVDKITQPEPLELVFSLYNGGVRRNVLISADPNSARLHTIRQRTRHSPIVAPAFCMLLRKYLEGGVLLDISQPLGFSERVLRLKFSGPSRDLTTLWIELMGRQSNIILTSDAGIILGAIKRVTSDMSRLREIRPNIPYTPPPRQLGYKRDPMEPQSAIGLPTEPFGTVEEAEKWLTATFRGVGALMAREAVLRSVGTLLTGESLWFGLNEILTAVRLNDYAPVVCHDDAGQVTLAYPIHLKSVAESLQLPAENISSALEAAYGSRLVVDALERERTALLSALRKSLKASERQLLDVREGLLNSELAEHIKESGELLLANIGSLAPGSKEATVDDYFAEEPEMERTIALDPALTIHENAERYFRRYQKARDSKEILLRRQDELVEAEAQIKKAMAEAESAETVQQLAALAESIGMEIRPNQVPGAKEAASKPAFEGHKIKTLKSPDGWEILVGESSTSNDYLTTKVASPSDIWLHARAVPSAHAVIRTQNRPASVSTAAILLAAEQVAKRSQAKHAGLVSIDYTLKKYVRKPRGSAAGQVTYTNEKTVDVIAREE